MRTRPSDLSSDTLIFKLLNKVDDAGGNGMDTWTNFDVGVAGNGSADFINLEALLDGKQNETNISDYLSVEVKDGNTVISIDHDGKTIVDENDVAVSGNEFNKTGLLTLTNVETTLDQLLLNNQIIY